MALSLQFFKPSQSSPTVVDNQGNYVSKEDYLRITGQQGLPDNQINWSYVQQGPPPGIPSNQSNVPLGGADTPEGFSTGVPELDELYNRMEKYITDLQAQGKKLNPNIEISPQTAQQFLNQATSEIEPFYAQKFRAIEENVRRNLSEQQRSYELQKEGQQAQFKQNLENIRERNAQAGTAFSGRRNLQEQQAQESQQRSLEGLGLSTGSQLGGTLRSAESQIGTGRTLGLGVPNVNVPTATTAGQGDFTSGRSLDFFAPQGVTGSLEYSQRADTRQLQDFLKDQEVKRRVLSFGG